MRKLIGLLFMTIMFLAGADLAGDYKGTWSGAASGDFHIVLTHAGDGWKADVSFTMGGDEVHTKMVSVKVDGNKLNLVYQYDLQGTELQSAIVGELKDKKFEGTYKAITVADGSDVDEGTWTVTAQ
jgi:hypothetical protein